MVFLSKPILLFLAKEQIKNIFKESDVTIRNCNTKSIRQLSFSGFEIKKDRLYNFKINEVNIYFSPFSIIKGNVLKVQFKEPLIKINFAKKSVSDFKSYLKLKPQRAFLINSLELSNLDLSLESKEFNLIAKASLSLDFLGQLINYLDINIESFDSQQFHLENTSLKANQAQSFRNFSIGLGSGTLTIKDNKFLENMAKNSGEPLDILVESFKNYRYNTGLMRVALDGRNLGFEISLDGETGKRNLNIVIHDFKGGRL
jgi:hypothetical protein